MGCNVGHPIPVAGPRCRVPRLTACIFCTVSASTSHVHLGFNVSPINIGCERSHPTLFLQPLLIRPLVDCLILRRKNLQAFSHSSPVVKDPVSPPFVLQQRPAVSAACISRVCGVPCSVPVRSVRSRASSIPSGYPL